MAGKPAPEWWGLPVAGGVTGASDRRREPAEGKLRPTLPLQHGIPGREDRLVLTIGTVVIGVDDMSRAVAFWTEALGYVLRDKELETTWNVLVPPDNDGTKLALDLSTSPVQELPRMHLDLYAGDAVDQAAEVERLVAIGARRVDWDHYPDDPDFVVLADTEGNRFCVIDTSYDG